VSNQDRNNYTEYAVFQVPQKIIAVQCFIWHYYATSHNTKINKAAKSVAEHSIIHQSSDSLQMRVSSLHDPHFNVNFVRDGLSLITVEFKHLHESYCSSELQCKASTHGCTHSLLWKNTHSLENGILPTMFMPQESKPAKEIELLP
jgi:hypothetical protein